MYTPPISSIYTQLLEVQHRLYAALESQTAYRDRNTEFGTENAYLRQEVQHLNQVQADLKAKLMLQSQEQAHIVIHARTCEHEKMAAVDSLESLQRVYQDMLAINKQNEARVTELKHAFNAYAEQQAEEMDRVRAVHTSQLRALASNYEKQTHVYKTETDAACSKRMDAAVEAWKQRCAAKDDKISKLKCDVHQARTTTKTQLIPPAKLGHVAESSSQTPRAARNKNKSHVAAAAAAAVIAASTPQTSSTNIEQHPMAATSTASREEVCELVEAIMTNIPESAWPQDALNKVRAGFIHFLEEHYHALDAYETERQCWHARLLALDDVTTADMNPQREINVFLRDQIVVMHEKARRELSSLHHALDCLFQLWIARPGDLTARETRSLNFMLGVITKTNLHSRATHTDEHFNTKEEEEEEEKCREVK